VTARFFNPSPQFFTAAGKVVAGGFVNFWATGTTNNQDTFPTSALSGANANPVPLDSAGRTTVPVFADPSESFSVRVIDADSVVVIATEDNVSFVRSNVITAADAVAALTANAAAGVYNGTQMTGTAFANFASNFDLTAAGSIDASAGSIILGTITGDLTATGDLLLSTTGSKIDFFSGDVTLTHASNKLTMAGGDLHIANGDGVVIGHTAQLTLDSEIPELQVLGTGAPDSRMFVSRFSANSSPPQLAMLKSRAAIGSFATVTAGDQLGAITFYGDDGTDYDTFSASITAISEGTIGTGRVPSTLVFRTGTDAASTVVTTALTLDSSQNATFAGNVILASGQGVDFSATSDSTGTATSELFDDYEEGTFTVVIADASAGGNTGGHAGTVGKYTKIGRIVHITLSLSDITTVGMTAGNDLFIRGLPFAAINTYVSVGSLVADTVAFAGQIAIYLAPGTFIRIAETATGVAEDFVIVSQITSGTSDIFASVTYETT